MKRFAVCAALLIGGAGYVFLQTVPAVPQLATLMPGGALVYLEAPDFGRLLREWDRSAVKINWLGSANYAVFSRSNLFNKLHDVYSQYGAAAGFVPDLQSAIGIAGTDSALALYEFRNVEFLYVSRVSEPDLMKSQLWAVRGKFEQRQAGGMSFYVRTDAASGRTVAFAFARGYLLLATRDDLVGQALDLLAGAKNPSVASDRWYREAAAAAPKPGELRLVMNLEALVKSTYFRSYWIQRNAPEIRRYWTGIADVRRAGNDITESRILLRIPAAAESESANAGTGSVSSLLGLVPPTAGLYKASRLAAASEAAALVVDKLIGPQPQRAAGQRYAPTAALLDSRTGSEGNLETRIDEEPLPADAGIGDSVAAVRGMLEKSGARALLLVQSSADAGEFVQLPAVVVVEGATDWDRGSVQNAIAAAAGKLWTASQLGAEWTNGTAGPHAVERLNGLGTLIFASQGRLLFLGNDAQLLAAVLDRSAGLPAGALTFAAGFRHARESSSYQRIMAALDFTSTPGLSRVGPGFGPNNKPAFFSENLGSLSRVLANVAEVNVTEEDRGATMVQTVIYRAQ